MIKLHLIGFLAAAIIAVPASAHPKPDEASLRSADAMQMHIIVEEDAKAQREFMHPDYILNAPSNRVMRKDQLVSMLAQGQMASASKEPSKPPLSPVMLAL